MAIPLIGAASAYVKANFLNAFIGSSLGIGVIALYDKVFGDKDKELDKKVDSVVNNINNTPVPPASSGVSLISVIAEQNKIFAVQTQLLSSLVSAVKVLGVNNLASNPDMASILIPALNSLRVKEKTKRDLNLIFLRAIVLLKIFQKI